MNNVNTIQPETIQKSIAAGNWKPNMYLTNVSIAYLQNPANYGKGLRLFPRVQVPLSAGHFYKFDKASVSRDDVQRKPQFGKVNPVIMGNDEDTYSCKIDQIIMGIDQITALNYQRSGAVGLNNPARAKTIIATEKMNIHMDAVFARNFFNAGVWGNEMTGTSTTPSGSQFYQFDNANSDPIKLFDDLIDEITREGRRRPNKLALGVDAFKGLKHNPMIYERIKYGGSTANPATVNTRVLAELFGIDEIVVLDSTYNTAEEGNPAQMEYICDSKGALLLYAPNSPMIDEPSAGYTFTWDPLGNGSPVTFRQWKGEEGTYSEFVEGICSYDMKKVCDDMAVYLKDCVS